MPRNIYACCNAKGLGTCWVIYARELTNPAPLEQIGVPENHTIVAPIIIGFPAIVPAPPNRKTATTLKLKS
jgi:nitroreductase